jgi:hypothetical protein
VNGARTLNLKMTRGRQAYWLGVFLMILLTGLSILGLYLFSPDWLKSAHSLPVVLLSPHRADYGVDPSDQMRQNPLSIALLGEVARDQVSQAGQPSTNPMPTLMEILKFPVPSVTPILSGTQEPLITLQPTQNGQPSTATQILPTSTTTGTRTSATPNGSATPTGSAAVTATPVSSATRTPAVQKPSSTAVPPTHAPQPTNPPPTKVPPTKVPPTKVPPTAVPPTNPPPTAYVPPQQPTAVPNYP